MLFIDTDHSFSAGNDSCTVQWLVNLYTQTEN